MPFYVCKLYPVRYIISKNNKRVSKTPMGRGKLGFALLSFFYSDLNFLIQQAAKNKKVACEVKNFTNDQFIGGCVYFNW